MLNSQTFKTPMPQQEPEVRASNFGEVALGYSAAEAVSEANRCLGCKARPCVSGCPVGVPIPDFIARLKEGDTEGAYAVLSSANALPAVCGRVCPQESQCEARCVRALKGESVAIGRLERFAADAHMACDSSAPASAPSPKKGRVAVVGSGPAGLTCAGELARRGYSVTVFEAFHKAGGVLVYGIPEFRLPKAIVAKEIDGLRALGVEIRTDFVVGRTLSVDELLDEGYDALFIGSGAGFPKFLGVKGENAVGVLSANEFLTRVNLMKAYDPEYDTPVSLGKTVAVVGGGNVAMDAARCARRLGAEVSIVYRRGAEELPARAEEVAHAREEGIGFRMLTNPVEVLTDTKGLVSGLRCVEMELGEPDASGRRKPVEKPGSEFTFGVETVIIALGTTPNPLISRTTSGLDFNRRGCLVVDENMKTSREGVYAGGDAVTGAATVILAMGAGKQAASSISEYLENKFN